jgi:hypothetical protein
MIPHDTHLQIGSLLFEGVDQIDLTGLFEVLAGDAEQHRGTAAGLGGKRG